MRKKLKIFTLGGLLCLSNLCFSDMKFSNTESVGRYLSVIVGPRNDQKNLLEQQNKIKFPEDVLTIKEAVQFTLKFSGYNLARNRAMNWPAQVMLNQALPEIDRIFGPMTLLQMLITLSGRGFYLLVDPVHRLIAYKIKPNYSQLYLKSRTK